MSKEDKYSSIHYTSYLKLDKLLGAQEARSPKFGKEAHEETLFIIVHQVYELWFKQIIHELQSIHQMFHQDEVDEKNVGITVERLERVSEIFKLLIQQIRVIETLTPLDFLDFRNYLFPASGFQSMQFRVMENMLGLRRKDRLAFTDNEYDYVFDEGTKTKLKAIEDGQSVLQLVESWLERIPFLSFGEFDFLSAYKDAVKRMLDKERKAITDTDILSDEMKAMRLKMLGSTDTYFSAILDKDQYDKMLESGEVKISYKASLSALLISLYREQPILHMPYRLIQSLTTLDDLVTTWRYRHSQMVLGMLGRKVGTGGSSGHEYLLKTAMSHHIFKDFHNISTLMIPRSELPKLPDFVIAQLGFHFTESNK